MAGDSKSTTWRQNSAASGRPVTATTQPRQQSKHIGSLNATAPLSAHLADPFLQDFLGPSFDAAEYFNRALPLLQGAQHQLKAASGQPAVALMDLSSQAQTTLSQLNAHTTRLTTTLTQLTDDILRSGSRLVYEVELLRGETLGLSESLNERLHDEIVRFVPGGLFEQQEKALDHATKAKVQGASEPCEADDRHDKETASTAPAAVTQQPTTCPDSEPPFITQLRTLSLVRFRLEAVVKTFADAMEFVFPPSELSVSSSFLSVSGPDVEDKMRSTEEKGRQVQQKLRDEISGLLSTAGDAVQGIEEAAQRIEELKELAIVWKGTAEEKGRTRFIEGLAKMVEERHRDLLKEMAAGQQFSSLMGAAEAGSSSGLVKKGAAEEPAPAIENRGYAGPYGLISQLQKLRNGL